MRSLLGFLCFCALCVVPLVGCGETAGDGGTAGGPVDQVTCSESLPCTVWLLGDSNTVAMGDNFVPIDGNHPEYNTVNLGREGASSADGLADVESLLATRKAPEIAVVTYAGGDLLESYPAAPPGATSPTRAEVDRIYGNLEAICELLQSEGTYCVLGKSIGALTELHPLDEGLPPGAIDFAALTYFDKGYVLVGEAIEERYQPGWVSFRVPKDFDLWGHGDLFGYLHLTQAGYSIMSDRLEAKLDDLIIDPPKCQIDEDCDDQNECTEDRCIGGACESTPVADGTLCTEGECLAGVCAPIGAFPCTEQGIRDAISEGGGPHFFACDGTRPVVTQSEIFIGDDVILDGRGNLTVDGNEDHRVFQVSENVTAELRGFTITRGAAGKSGGGLWNEGTLTLSNCTVSENITNGITNHRGTLTLIDSAVWGNTYSDQGAGIRNQGAGEDWER